MFISRGPIECILTKEGTFSNHFQQFYTQKVYELKKGGGHPKTVWKENK